MPTATAVNWNVIYWIFRCKYQFECLSSLQTIYVIFILCCTIFHLLLFLDSLCLCLLFSHVQCCNHSDQLWERLKVSWTTLLCPEDFEMEKLVTDSSATSTLSSNTPLPTSSYALVNPLSLPLRVILCLQTAAEQLTWLMIKGKLLKYLIIFLLWHILFWGGCRRDKASSHPAWHRNDRLEWIWHWFL